MKKIFAPLYFLEVASRELTTTFKTPQELLTFLTKMIGWMHDLQCHADDDEKEFRAPAGEDHVYTVIRLIEDVIPVWYANIQDPVTPVAEALKGYLEDFPGESWGAMTSRFAAAISMDDSSGSTNMAGNVRKMELYTSFVKCIAHCRDYRNFSEKLKVAA